MGFAAPPGSGVERSYLAARDAEQLAEEPVAKVWFDQPTPMTLRGISVGWGSQNSAWGRIARRRPLTQVEMGGSRRKQQPAQDKKREQNERDFCYFQRKEVFFTALGNFT